MLRAVAEVEDGPLQSALERLAESDLILVQGLPPDSDYRFKHALIQDAAYENLLKSRRAVIHRRVAEILLYKFAGVATAEPEVLAYHFAQAGLDEPAIEWWGKAGDQALHRSAYVETIEHFGKAISLVETLPTTPALRREQIRLQVALITPLIHINGYAAPETKAATERARLLIEQSEALGEHPEEPLLLFTVLYGFAIANFVGFNGDALSERAAQFLALAEKQDAAVPRMIGHRLMGHAALLTGHIAEGRAHYDQVIALYDPKEHRPLAMRFGQDVLASILPFRALAIWAHGFPDAALADADRVVKHAREISHEASLLLTLTIGSMTHIYCGSYAAANTQSDEAVSLAEEKGIVGFKGIAMADRGWLLALTGKPSDAVQTIISGINGWRSTGGTLFAPAWRSGLARAFADIGQADEAWRSIAEAMALIETTKQHFFEAETFRTAGEIALMSPQPEAAKAEAYFERALAVARKQQAKSWELRAAMSMARLWRDQGKRDEARELLAPVCGWFTEGFDTRDLKEAKALLDELAQAPYQNHRG
jgi:predicted ATPase